MVLLGAYRDTEAPPELRELAGEAQQLALAGLALGEVGTLARELAGEEVPAQVTAQLWQRSGGNPFFVRELTRLLLAQGRGASRPDPGQCRGDAAPEAGPAVHRMRAAAGMGGRRGPRH